MVSSKNVLCSSCCCLCLPGIKLYHFLRLRTPRVLVYQEMDSENLGCRIYACKLFAWKRLAALSSYYSRTPKLTRDRYRRATASTLYADMSRNRSSSGRRSFRLRTSAILPLLLCVRYSYASYYRKLQKYCVRRAQEQNHRFFCKRVYTTSAPIVNHLLLLPLLLLMVLARSDARAERGSESLMGR